MKYFRVVSLPCIMKWSGLQDLLIRLLVIFSYLKLQVFVTPPLDIQDEQNQIQVEFENLRENPGVIHNPVRIKVKIDEFVFKNTAGMLNKNLQKQFPTVVCRNSCYVNMQEIYRRTPMRNYDFSKGAMQLY